MSIPSGTQILTFSTKYTGVANQLITEVEITFPGSVSSKKVRAIWDTGATATVITEQIVTDLGLVATGMVNVDTANGSTIQNTYIVDVSLPNTVLVKDVTVTAAKTLSSGCEVLIGMDIIALGDFSITHYEGKTCMSFRFPSCHEIDYVTNPHYGIRPSKNLPSGTMGSKFTPPKKKRRR